MFLGNLTGAKRSMKEIKYPNDLLEVFLRAKNNWINLRGRLAEWNLYCILSHIKAIKLFTFTSLDKCHQLFTQMFVCVNQTLIIAHCLYIYCFYCFHLSQTKMYDIQVILFRITSILAFVELVSIRKRVFLIGCLLCIKYEWNTIENRYNKYNCKEISDEDVCEINFIGLLDDLERMPMSRGSFLHRLSTSNANVDRE